MLSSKRTDLSTASIRLRDAIDLRLALFLGTSANANDEDNLTSLAAPLLARFQEVSRQLKEPYCPADHRIQAWLDYYLANLGGAPRLPLRTLILDQPGLARALSLPADADEFFSPLLKSYRVRQGVLHNPANDRRTTQGVFHIAEGGLPIPDDKRAVPASTYAKLLALAFEAPAGSMTLPYTHGRSTPVECFVSLLLRPLLCPAVPEFIDEKRTEIRFIVPGSLVSNLDFVKAIFGNAGDPHLPQNDAGLDIDHWTGHTGCIVLAPHLTRVTKKQVGLPAGRPRANASAATACAGKPSMSSTTTARPSRSPPAMNTASW